MTWKSTYMEFESSNLREFAYISYYSLFIHKYASDINLHLFHNQKKFK